MRRLHHHWLCCNVKTFAVFAEQTCWLTRCFTPYFCTTLLHHACYQRIFLQVIGNGMFFKLTVQAESAGYTIVAVAVGWHLFCHCCTHPQAEEMLLKGTNVFDAALLLSTGMTTLINLQLQARLPVKIVTMVVVMARSFLCLCYTLTQPKQMLSDKINAWFHPAPMHCLKVATSHCSVCTRKQSWQAMLSWSLVCFEVPLASVIATCRQKMCDIANKHWLVACRMQASGNATSLASKRKQREQAILQFFVVLCQGCLSLLGVNTGRTCLPKNI